MPSSNTGPQFFTILRYLCTSINGRKLIYDIIDEVLGNDNIQSIVHTHCVYDSTNWRNFSFFGISFFLSFGCSILRSFIEICIAHSNKIVHNFHLTTTRERNKKKTVTANIFIDLSFSLLLLQVRLEDELKATKWHNRHESSKIMSKAIWEHREITRRKENKRKERKEIHKKQHTNHDEQMLCKVRGTLSTVVYLYKFRSEQIVEKQCFVAFIFFFFFFSNFFFLWKQEMKKNK